MLEHSRPVSWFLSLSLYSHLTILPVHSVNRDDRKCSAKYGAYRDEYRKLVPGRFYRGVLSCSLQNKVLQPRKLMINFILPLVFATLLDKR